MMVSDVWRLSVAYIGPKSRTEMPIKIKNWHRGSPRHTRLGHHFQGQKVKGQGHQTALLAAALTREAGAAVTVRTYWAWETVLLRCVWSAAREALGRPRGRRGVGAYRVATRTACCYTPCGGIKRWCRLSVCPSVQCLTLSREWTTSIASWKLARRKRMKLVTCDPI